ncbi:ABCB family ABC transporter ATP-binding protein/permease [Alteromonas sp. ASW11-130]|uniref:ABCB family ABC transporter ATP-binding protein/permease n=1 Tax=Alteromonas sp. ASW11-130 TaxID=3015775 RepID=UPI002242C18A|nr:ABC transporter ATP-binding protein/permease [Alteromonas sp. ASW11-130]MCW8091377.1 ABC transporter ATP-binding protein/permease [Alteromonas sp. ASW11-130]
MRSSRFPTATNTPIRWQVFPLLLPYLLEFKSRIFVALLCLIGAKIATIGLPYILKYTVDSLNAPSPADIAIVVVTALVIAYGSLRLLNVLLSEVRDTLFGRVTERAMRRLGLAVFNHLHSLDLSYHLNRQTGGLARDIERGSSGVSFLMRFLVFNIVPTFIEIFIVAALLLSQYGAGYAVIILLSVVCYVAFSIIATNWRTHFVNEMNQADSASNSRAIDSLLNYETVKYFNNEQYESRHYDNSLAHWETARRKNRLSLFALNGGQALIIALAMTAMMAMAAFDVAAQKMTIGDFVLINAFTMQIFTPLNFLGFVYREIRGAIANIDNLFTILEKRSTIEDKSDAPPLCVQSSRLTFDTVNFSYDDNRPILKNVSFTIEPGQKVAVVGESGGGKSTLVKLLFRFYDVSSGAILVDQTDIRTVSQQSLRKAFGVVPQDTVLFNDSIWENVKYGNPTASDKEVWHAIEQAQLSPFIESLPAKENTKVGERGLKVSGGEKQRIAIARVLLKNPPFLLFDEATSSLDTHAEKRVMQAINLVARSASTLIIAHRLSTVVDADTIIVLHQGEIAERGTHSQLLKKNGRYAKLWNAQLKESTH